MLILANSHEALPLSAEAVRDVKIRMLAFLPTLEKTLKQMVQDAQEEKLSKTFYTTSEIRFHALNQLAGEFLNKAKAFLAISDSVSDEIESLNSINQNEIVTVLSTGQSEMVCDRIMALCSDSYIDGLSSDLTQEKKLNAAFDAMSNLLRAMLVHRDKPTDDRERGYVGVKDINALAVVARSADEVETSVNTWIDDIKQSVTSPDLDMSDFGATVVYTKPVAH